MLCLVADKVAGDVWGQPAKKRDVPLGREPARVSNLRKRRDRIRASQLRMATGGVVDRRQASAVAALADVDRELAEWDRAVSGRWASRAAWLLATTTTASRGSESGGTATDSPGSSPHRSSSSSSPFDGLAQFSTAFHGTRPTGGPREEAAFACALDTCMAVVADVLADERCPVPVAASHHGAIGGPVAH